MKLITTTFAMLFSLSLFSQNPYIDSLKTVAKTGSLDDQVRVKVNLALIYRGQGRYDEFETELSEAVKIGNKAEVKTPLIKALLTRGWTYAYPPKVNLDSSLYYIREGKKLAESLSHQLGLAESHYELGYHYAYFKSEYEDSVDYFFKKAIEFFDADTQGGENMIIDSYKNLSFYHNRIGNIEKALSYVDSAETYRKDPHIMNVRAIIYDNTGQYARAIDTYLQSLSLSLANNDTASINGSYNNIAAAYGNQGNPGKAKEYFLKSWNLTKLKLGSASGFDIVQILRNVGMVYDELGIVDSAKFFFNKAIKEGEARQVIDPMYAPYFGMGEMFYNLGKLDSAEWYLKKSLEYTEQANEMRVRASAKRVLGDISFDIGDYSTALKWYNESLTDAESVDYVKTITTAYQGIYKTQKQLGNYKKALEANEKFKFYSDSIFNKSNTEKISELEAKFLYDQEKKDLVAEQEKETLLLEGEVKRQRDLQTMYLAISAAFVLLFILAVYSYRRKNRDNKIIQEKSDELEKSNKELAELSEFKQGMTNMIAHDIKNPLNSIIGLSGKLEKKIGADISKAGQAVLRLITNMLDVEKFEETKPVLTLETAKVSSLVEEAKLAVELLLHDKSIDLSIDIPQDVNVQVDQELLARVLINLLSNAIKFSPSNDKISLSVLVSEEEGARNLQINISDNGLGIPEEDQPYLFEKFYQSQAKKSGLAPSTGLGLTFCKMVIDAHGGSISVSSQTGEGSTFTINLKADQLADENVNTGQVDTVLTLTESDIKVLSDYAERLKELKVHNVGAIMPILDEIESLDLDIDWPSQVRSAVQYSNKEQYQRLLEMVK